MVATTGAVPHPSETSESDTVLCWMKLPTSREHHTTLAKRQSAAPQGKNLGKPSPLTYVEWRNEGAVVKRSVVVISATAPVGRIRNHRASEGELWSTFSHYKVTKPTTAHHLCTVIARLPPMSEPLRPAARRSTFVATLRITTSLSTCTFRAANESDFIHTSKHCEQVF